MKQGTLLGSALVAALALAAMPAAAADKASPKLATACVDSSGKPVTDASVCASGGCVDASGKPVTDVSVCASSSSSSSSSSSQETKSPRDAASGMATGKRQH
jgi:hypothetical protein